MSSIAVLGLEEPTYTLNENNTAYQLRLRVLSTNITMLQKTARLRPNAIPGTAQSKSKLKFDNSPLLNI